MSQELDRALAIQLDDGRVVVATPKPEDQDRLVKLDKDIVLLTASGDYDTSGHGYGDLVELDVEGHAITLRFPSPADAEAVRKALAVGAVTATIVAAGAIAALQGPAVPPQAVPQAAPAAPAVQSSTASQADQDRDLGIMDLGTSAAPSVQSSTATQAQQDRDLGITDLGAPAKPAAPAAPSTASQAEQDRDLGITDLGAPAAPAVDTALDRATFQEDRLAERDPLWGTQPATSSDSESAPASTDSENAGTHGSGRGELEKP
jgi:hypothetical protein